jgi:uncharacterized repeat protein (TIGR04138 family)
MNSIGFETAVQAVPDSWTHAYAHLHRHGEAHFPPACLYYVQTVVRQAAAHTGPTHASLSPAMVIEAFRAATRADFGPLRDDVLAQWGLREPRDLGLAVNLLGRAGVLTVDEGDAPEIYTADTMAFIGDAS